MGIPTTTAALPNGGAMPLVGLGTWQLRGAQAVSAVQAALATGYRHLDTATIYGNEREIGQALRDSDVGPDEVFLTTKLPPDRADQARRTLEESLTALGRDQVDLWLVHWPSGGDDVDLWRTFVQAQEQGLVRDIGVSNFDLRMIDEVTDATGVRPAVNQIKWSPLRFDAGFLAGHLERGIVFEGYSGLKGGTLDHPVITGLAERLGRTPAQVIVRWHLEHGTVVIPKSGDPGRIVANADVDGFALTPEDVAALDALGTA